MGADAGFGDYLGWVAFVGGSLAMALILWRRRNPDAVSLSGGWVSFMLPTVIVALSLLGAWAEGRGTRLAASIERFSIPFEAAPPSGKGVLLFRIADRVEAGDLVVQPYLQDYLNRITLADPPRHLVEIYGRRLDGLGGALETRVAVTDIPGNAEEERPAMRIAVNDGDLEGALAGRRYYILQPGQSLRLRIYRQDMSLDADADGPGLQSRRSLVIVNEAPEKGLPGSIEVVPDQPLLSDAGSCQAPRDVLVPAAVEGSPPPGYLQPRNLEFRALGLGNHQHAVMRDGSVGPLAGGDLRCASDMPSVTWPAADSGDRTSMRIAYTFVGLPWFLTFLLGAASAVALMLGRAASGAERLLMPALLYFVGVRAMVAIAAAYYDPAEPTAGFYADSASTIVFLPPLLAAIIRPGGASLRQEWAMWIGAMLALGLTAWLWLLPFTPGLSDLAVPVLALGMVALRLAFPQFNPLAVASQKLAALLVSERRTVGFLGLLDWISIELGKLRQPWLAQTLQPLLASPLLRHGVSLLLLAAVVRILLWIVGLATSLPFKERIFFLPLSLPYLLALFFGTAMAVVAIRSMIKGRAQAALLLSGGLLAAMAALLLVRDTGFMLVHLVPICAVAAWHLWNRKAEARTGLAPAALALAPVGFMILGLALLTWSALGKVALLELWQGQTSHLAERMAIATRIDANALRLVQLFAPQSVELVGTRAAYEQMNQTAMMHMLGSALAGNGWLQPVELLSIRKEQTWDYVAAVHIMFPFGRIGVLAFLSVVGGMVSAALVGGMQPATAALHYETAGPAPPADAADSREVEVLGLVSQMAGWTLLFSAIYLVLGNLLLVPFTGRSIYLISVMSTGEVIEGMMLLGLLALAFPAARE